MGAGIHLHTWRSDPFLCACLLVAIILQPGDEMESGLGKHVKYGWSRSTELPKPHGFRLLLSLPGVFLASLE